MKTIEAILIAALLSGVVIKAVDYLTTECATTAYRVKAFPNGQAHYTEFKTGRCYLLD